MRRFNKGLRMLKLILKRVLGTLVLLFAVAIASFVLIHLAPGDFLSELSANPQISPETIAHLREKYGLDQHWSAQFGKWLIQILRGDLGFSFGYNRPVTDLIGERLSNTVALAMTALFLSLLVAIPGGVFAASGRLRFLS